MKVEIQDRKLEVEFLGSQACGSRATGASDAAPSQTDARPGPRTSGLRRGQHDPAWVRWTLTGLAVLVLTLLIVIPVTFVFWQAFANGPAAYVKALVGDSDTLKAIAVTLAVAPGAVVLNVIFGVAAGWAVARFQFPGRTLLQALINLPFSVSPVVVGLVFVLLFGLQGYFGAWLDQNGMRFIGSFPAMVLVTAFVTFPFVARELIPVMEATSADEEMAALSLGANGWQMFWRVTLPNIKWGLLYGVILCNARAMGEFGAVYVVSGRVVGGMTTVPLRVEMLFVNYRLAESFALASLLTALALVTLGVKTVLERKVRKQLEEALRDRTSNTNHG